MISREWRCCGALFTWSRRVKQGDPLSPTIFKILHWEIRVAGEDAGPEGFGRVVQNIAALLYTDGADPVTGIPGYPYTPVWNGRTLDQFIK